MRKCIRQSFRPGNGEARFRKLIEARPEYLKAVAPQPRLLLAIEPMNEPGRAPFVGSHSTIVSTSTASRSLSGCPRGAKKPDRRLPSTEVELGLECDPAAREHADVRSQRRSRSGRTCEDIRMV